MSQVTMSKKNAEAKPGRNLLPQLLTGKQTPPKKNNNNNNYITHSLAVCHQCLWISIVKAVQPGVSKFLVEVTLTHRMKE